MRGTGVCLKERLFCFEGGKWIVGREGNELFEGEKRNCSKGRPGVVCRGKEGLLEAAKRCLKRTRTTGVARRKEELFEERKRSRLEERGVCLKGGEELFEGGSMPSLKGKSSLIVLIVFFQVKAHRWCLLLTRCGLI